VNRSGRRDVNSGPSGDWCSSSQSRWLYSRRHETHSFVPGARPIWDCRVGFTLHWGACQRDATLESISMWRTKKNVLIPELPRLLDRGRVLDLPLRMRNRSARRLTTANIFAAMLVGEWCWMFQRVRSVTRRRRTARGARSATCHTQGAPQATLGCVVRPGWCLNADQCGAPSSYPQGP
jgi:hypothetical protein